MGDSFNATHLRYAAFLRPAAPLEFARLPISGMLIGGFGLVDDGKAFGLLHPSPLYPFDRRVLPQIEFAEISYDAEHLMVKWS